MKAIQKLLLIILLTIILVSSSLAVVHAADLENTENQYMELKVVSIKDTENNGKQVIMEWWSYNLNFKGLDLRFSYDTSKVAPSNVQDNSSVTKANAAASFEFAGDFASYMKYVPVSAENGEYRCAMSLENYDDTGTYIENNGDLGYIVNTNVEGGVLIGKMSFKLLSGNLDNTTFALKPGTTSPQTGIKIDQTMQDSYTDETVFRFSILSNDATLKKIDYDFFNYQDEDGNQVLPELTYETLDMTKLDEDSTDDISKYTINLLENVENISLKLEKSNEHATIKINDEEIDISKTKELMLNKLGEEDTTIDIIVTAQDGTTIHTYRLVIHRPYGTIKGSIQLGENLRDEMLATNGNYVEYIANVTLYEPEKMEWDKIISKEASFEQLDDLEIQAQTQTDKDDGSYTIYVVPGKYDLILERLGFLANVVKNITISESQTIDLGNKVLIEGDSNRDGIIDLNDNVKVIEKSDSTVGDGIYEEQCDFGQKGFIDLKDLVSTVQNADLLITIEEY